MSVLIIGGAGFIGSKIARKLLNQNKKVVCFDANLNSKFIEDIIDKVKVMKGDIAFIEEVVGAIKENDVSTVINMAYIMGSESDANPNLAIRVNVLGMNNVFEAAKIMNIKRVLYTSSIAYHGPHQYFGDKAVKEEDLGGVPVQTYSATKRLNEYMASKYSEKYNMEVVGLRASIVYGHGRETGLTSWSGKFASNPAIEKQFVFSYRPEQKCNIVYVDDVAEMFTRLVLADKIQHPVYLTGGHMVSMSQLVEEVKELIPSADMEFQPTIKDIPLVYNVDSSKFEKEFDFKHTPLREGLKMHINNARLSVGLEPFIWKN